MPAKKSAPKDASPELSKPAASAKAAAPKAKSAKPKRSDTKPPKVPPATAAETAVAEPPPAAETAVAELPAAAPKISQPKGPGTSLVKAPDRRTARGLHILMIASEATPFSKTGGLADVASSLSKALGRLGHKVTLVTPKHRGAQSGEPRDIVRAVVADQHLEATLERVELGPGAEALLIDCPALYDRAGLYTENGAEYGDNPIRYAFLSIAALEWAAAQPSFPDIVHGHDWHAGLAPVYARRFAPASDDQASVPCVFTIHNMMYQGRFDKSWVPRLGLNWNDFSVDGFEAWDRLSFLKAGLTFSHALTTVSPNYAKEIQTPEGGFHFDSIVRSRSDVLTGIVNGIDVHEWDPANDPYLPQPFTAEDLAGKRAAKRALLEMSGLPSDDAAMGRPVIGMVSRLAHQKGLDLIEAIEGYLPTLDATFVVVGTGEPGFENMWRRLAAAAPDRIAAHIGFDEQRAHLVEGGADMFLMPSLFEPCGLNQMYSMRYGTIPIVRAVGGLADTVKPYNPRGGQGTGFVFAEYDPGALLDAIRRALDTYRQPRIWQRLQINGMTKDFSWDRSAAEYVKVYKGVIARRRPKATGVGAR